MDEETISNNLASMDNCINCCLSWNLCYLCKESTAIIYEERKTLRRKCQELLDENEVLSAKVRLCEALNVMHQRHIEQLTRKLSDAERLLSGMPSAEPVLSGGEDSPVQDAPST